ncbi:MAG TPA: hypothetical protein VF677_15565 [Flavobacterium sp.]|jgi:hypothetical protein
MNILTAIKSKEITSITRDLTEVAIDLMLENGILKDLPIVGTLYNVYNFSQNVSNAFFAKKILKFLLELNDIPESERLEFIQKLESGEETQKVGEKLLVVLNKFDDVDKATILGRIFKITISEEIELSTFTRLAYMIDKVYLQDLKELKNKFVDNLSSDTRHNLSQVGILNQTLKDNREHEEYVFRNTGKREFYPPKFEYEISDYGEILIKHGL